MPKNCRLMLALVCVVWAGGAGCVQRTLTVRSNPPGALVYMNDQEIGRTPVTRNFMWYGIYDIELRIADYQSIKTTARVIAPWWQWVPFDLLAEALPLTDHHELIYTLRPPTEEQLQPDLLARRGELLRGELAPSQRATSQPTTRPKHPKKVTSPQTRPAV